MSTSINKFDIKNYSLYAVAFLGCDTAFTQVVYTDIVPDAVLTIGTNLLDMDNNGEADFSIIC